MDFSELSPELKAKARECKSLEEIFTLAADSGVEPTDEELEMISGSTDWECPLNDSGCENFSAR